MAKIISVTLLLVILVNSFYDGTALRVGFPVTKGHIRKCGCRVFPSGTIKCRSPLFNAKHAIPVQKEDLIKCFCSKRAKDRFPEFQAACLKWHPNYPITLL